MRSARVTAAEFAMLAKAGDISHGVDEESGQQKDHSYAALARTCKANIEFDRVKSAEEAGYRTGMFRLINHGATGKAELIVGVPGGDAYGDLLK